MTARQGKASQARRPFVLNGILANILLIAARLIVLAGLFGAANFVTLNHYWLANRLGRNPDLV